MQIIQQRIKGLISICKKAGYLIIGGDNLYYTLSETVVSGAVDIKTADASGAIEPSYYIFEIKCF